MGGLGGVLHQVQEDLDQLILVAPDRRQRGIVVLLRCAGRRRSRWRPARRTRSSTWWMLTGASSARASSENASIRSTSRRTRSVSSTDQLGRAVVLGRRRLQQLGRAADAGQRVLDLVGQHPAMAEAPRAAPRELSWRFIICAVELSCRVSTTAPGISGSGAPWAATPGGAAAGYPGSGRGPKPAPHAGGSGRAGRTAGCPPASDHPAASPGQRAEDSWKNNSAAGLT